jgi:hypothetical protein
VTKLTSGDMDQGDACFGELFGVHGRVSLIVLLLYFGGLLQQLEGEQPHWLEAPGCETE